DRVRHPFGHQGGPVDGVHGEVAIRAQPVADLFAVVEHWRLVFFALADDYHAAHRHRGDELAHRVDGGPVAAFLVAAAHPAAGRHRAGLGDSHQLQRQVAIRAHVQSGVQWSRHGRAFLECACTVKCCVVLRDSQFGANERMILSAATVTAARPSLHTETASAFGIAFDNECSTAERYARRSSALTLTLATPQLRAPRSCSVGSPLAPCRTRGTGHCAAIALSRSRSRVTGLAVNPCTFPTATARASIPVRSTKSRACSGSVMVCDGSAFVETSSSPGTAPSSASIQAPARWARVAASCVQRILSSKLSCEPSILTDESPAPRPRCISGSSRQ